jgi:Eukaryotic aspartyl protease
VTNDVARQIYSGTPGAQAISDTEWSIPCNSVFPISLTFGGKPFTITERDTIIQQSSGLCTGVVTGGATQAIGKVGAPFLRNVYTFVSSFPIMPTLGGV